MSTRATISMLNQDGSVTSIYCHYDGYDHSRGAGAILKKYFKTEKYVENFLSHGSCKSVDQTIGSIDFFEDSGSPTNYVDWQDYEKNCNFQEYNYMYCDGNWTVAAASADNGFANF